MTKEKDRLLQAKLHDLGFDVIEKHIFLCADQTEANCAPRKKTILSWEFLKQRLNELNLDGRGGVYRSKVNCLRVCSQGPIAVVYPDGVWYNKLKPEDVNEILDSHISNGKKVDRLEMDESLWG